MIIDFDDIRHLIPGFVFNEYGQLTGNFVRREEIVCIEEDGRIQIWLDQAGYDAGDPDRLICDYSARVLRGEG